MMKRLLPLLFLAGTAQAMPPPLDGFYVGLMGTGSYLSTMDYYTPWPSTFTPPFTGLTTTRVTTRLKSNIGGGGGGELGYRFRCFRIEGELLYNINVMNKITYRGHTVGHSQNLADLTGVPYLHGQTSEYMGFFNFFYDIRLDNPHSKSQAVPYIGIGVGYDSMRYSSDFSAKDWVGTTGTARALPGTSNQVTASGLTGQAIAGLAYDMDSFATFFFDFRAIAIKTSAENHNTSSSGLKNYMPLYTLNLGLNFVFSNSRNA